MSVLVGLQARATQTIFGLAHQMRTCFYLFSLIPVNFISFFFSLFLLFQSLLSVFVKVTLTVYGNRLVTEQKGLNEITRS